MSYITESLAPNEVIVGRASFHWLYKAAAWLSLVAGAGVAAALAGFAYPRWLAALAFAAGALLFLRIMLRIWTTEIGVTNQRLIVKTGLIGRETDEVELWSIEEINLTQDALGRILGFGRLNIQGTGDDSLSVPVIADPIGFRKTIETAIGQSAARRNRTAT